MHADHPASFKAAPRAWVVDDDADILATVCRSLKQYGFEAAGFASTAALFAALTKQRPEVLILDLALGESDAVEVIHQLESIAYRGKLLLISGRDASSLREVEEIGRARGLAMLSPLAKPFCASDLNGRLQEDPIAPRETPCSTQLPMAVSIDLAEALRKNWLELWYQPKVDVPSMRVCGAEALLRARHPQHGIIPPAGFLPAPGDPLYQPLSEFVLSRAMTDWLRFSEHGLDLRLAVNIPVSVIRAPGFVTLVRRALPGRAAFPGLILEVTEDEVISDPTRVKEVAAQLKLYDVRLSIDDFGSAYSSLSRLLDLSFAEVKLDRSLVAHCASQPLKHAVCQTVIDLSHRFDALVCAEGVEGAEDLRALAAMGCDVVQGFLFAQAMPFDAFVAEMHRRDSRFTVPATGSAGRARDAGSSGGAVRP